MYMNSTAVCSFDLFYESKKSEQKYIFMPQSMSSVTKILTFICVIHVSSRNSDRILFTKVKCLYYVIN